MTNENIPELEAARRRVAELEAELETARSGPAARQPWNKREGTAAEIARSALQDAIFHVQRDGELGLARRCARHAADLIPASPVAAPRPSAAQIERAARRLNEIIGQLGAAIDQVGVQFGRAAQRAHLCEIKEAARRAAAELAGEDL